MTDTQPQDSQDTLTSAQEEPAKTGRKRPRIDMATDAGQRKRGKSMFALALGTLTKAKNEDRARNQSEAVRPKFVCQYMGSGFLTAGARQKSGKRSSSDCKRSCARRPTRCAARRRRRRTRRPQIARRRNCSSRTRSYVFLITLPRPPPWRLRALWLTHFQHKLRRTRLPILANFLITSDTIPDVPPADPERSSASPPPAPATPINTDSNEPAQDADSKNLSSATARASRAPALTGPPRSHPPPLYYLPAILTPAQEAFIKRRKEEVRPS